jgi:hypothetical protein|uniref:Ycf86 protein n=2 Tax=Cyanidioschyzon merolae TaxID=45157 RepID=Q85FY9_CYAM1|nr:ORF87 [Cyanidioschyzon merolae strain 10D]QFV17093.1 hypothetical protein [Cyanidioschyzon merolae]QFV17267.1 hypothetical protein [Cyanidioschyzon merolae]BAC76204.1 ycf86 [Cyanidioschyzon merolae strain 10D]
MRRYGIGQKIRIKRVPMKNQIGQIATIKGYKQNQDKNQYIIETNNGDRFWVFPQEIETTFTLVRENDDRKSLAKRENFYRGFPITPS